MLSSYIIIFIHPSSTCLLYIPRAPGVVQGAEDRAVTETDPKNADVYETYMVTEECRFKK